MGGTTLADPVGPDQRPDLAGSMHEIQEYLQGQDAYDLFECMLKELIVKQPEDPLQHMLSVLQADYPSNSGPLKISVTSAPGSIARQELSKRLAEQFGLAYISAGDLLREAKEDTEAIAYADDIKITESIVEQVKSATDRMQGFVLDGFPRTRIQATYLKEKCVVPTHVFVLKTSEQEILDRQKKIEEGIIPGTFLAQEMLLQKLRLYTCHVSAAMESYQEQMRVIDTMPGEAHVWAEMQRYVRMRARSNAPKLPPRIVIVGPRGIGVREHASQLATRLGAVFVDGFEVMKATFVTADGGVTDETREQRGPRASVELLTSTAQSDPLGTVGVRLRQPDCTQLGWVMCGFPENEQQAAMLREDSHLAPTRVLALIATAETCSNRLLHHYLDPISGRVWTSLPRNQQVRERLQRRPEDQPAVVETLHINFMQSIDGILEKLGTDGRCTKVSADGEPLGVFKDVVEFVERPLPLQDRS